jgi:hypothetical protein
MFHRVQNKNPLGNIFIFVSREPIRKNGIGRFRFISSELNHLDTRILKCTFEIVEFFLGLKIIRIIICPLKQELYNITNKNFLKRLIMRLSQKIYLPAS